MIEQRIVKLIEPEICKDCRFAAVATANLNGFRKQYIHCKRLDCDNWVMDGSIKIDSITDVNTIPRD